MADAKKIPFTPAANAAVYKHPLRWFLVGWLGLVYLQGMVESGSGPRLPSGEKIYLGINPDDFALIAFTTLMALHCGLHWLVLFQKPQSGWVMRYLVVQGGVVVLILYLADAQTPALGLCLALTLEAIHLLKWTRSLLSIVVGYLLIYTLALDPLGFILVADFPSFIHKLFNTLIFIFFVIACAILYRRQAQAHLHDQDLLAELTLTHSRLEDAHRRLEEYTEQVEHLTLITERQRLARELHDTLAQGLVGLTMQLETIDALLAKQSSQPAQQIVRQALVSARTTMHEARSAIDDLRIQALPEEKFVESIRTAIESFTSTSGIPCENKIGTVSNLPSFYREHVLTVVSEGLTNIARHSLANRAWVKMINEEGVFTIEVGDDGTGFNRTKAMDESKPGHYGLLGLGERAALTGGSLEIISRPGTGTLLRFHLPANVMSVREKPGENG